MRGAGIQGAKRRGKPWRTTIADPAARRSPDLVERDFTAARPDQLWVADFTYLRCWEGVVFFSFVIDVFSRRVVGWQFASHMRTDLVLDMSARVSDDEPNVMDRQRRQHETAGEQREAERGALAQQSVRTAHDQDGVAAGAHRREKPHGCLGSRVFVGVAERIADDQEQAGRPHGDQNRASDSQRPRRW